MSIDVSSIWWKQITGPVRLTENISRSLANDHSVIFIIPHDLPLRHEMRYSVEDLAREEGFIFEMIDCKDEFQGREIGKYLIERFGTKSDISEYRPHKFSAGEYLQQKGILKNKVLWVKGIPSNQVEDWLKFYRDFRGKTREQGLFVIEVNSIPSKLCFSAQTDIIRYFDYITKYDTHLFSSIVVAQSEIPVFLHHYVTAVVSSICIMDPEVAADMIHSIDFCKTDPLDGLEELFLKHYSATARGSINDLEEEHPFFLIRKGNKDKLSHRLWNAQLQVAFSLIEEGRIEFIQKYKSEIRNCMPVKQFEIEINDPYEAELGTLVYLASKRRQDLGFCRLHIPIINDYEQLHFLHDLRNKLAHYQLCTPEEMIHLLSKRGFIQHNIF